MSHTSDDDDPLSNLLEREILDLTGGTQTIENCHINDSTRTSYIAILRLFMVWLFDNRPEKLVSIGPLIIANQKDIDKRVRMAEREANARRRGRKRKRRKTYVCTRKFLRDACKEMLLCMDREKQNSPIHLTGDSAIGYCEISDFMNTKKKNCVCGQKPCRSVCWE